MPPVPTSAKHADGVVELAWGATATAGGGASYDAGGNGTIAPNPMQGAPAWNGASASCSATYCHGNYSGTFSFTFYDTPDSWNYARNSAAPVWNGGPMTCGSCHAIPPNNAGWHNGYHGPAGGNDCQLCHPDAVGTIKPVPGAATTVTGAAITDPKRHVNGIIDVVPRWDVGDCFGCH
jgi:predicted CxxxxCH...CXXCH cytochrome family protein